MDREKEKDDWDDCPSPQWECQECGAVHQWAVPKDRERHYRRRQAWRVCPTCRSESVVLVGY